MIYKTKVYISGVTNLSDARYAAGMLVDYLGFCIEDNHETALPETDFAAINGWIEGITMVGEFYEKSVEDINVLIEKYQLSVVQIPASRLSEAIHINAGSIILLDDGHVPDNLEEEQFIRTRDYSLKDYPNLFLEVDRQAVKGIDTADLFGICIRGGQEERPGYKDYDEIGDILEKIEV